MTTTNDNVEQFPAENPSGIQPSQFKVLVKPKEKYADNVSEGGIIIPETVDEREQAAADEGRIVAMGGRAFEDFGRRIINPDGGGERYEPSGIECGATVFFGRYAGQVVNGKDGEEYRLVNDKDIGAIVA